MNLQTPPFDASTSAGTTLTGSLSGVGAQRAKKIITVGGALFVAGTSCWEPTEVWGSYGEPQLDTTAGGQGVDAEEPAADQAPEATRKAISELRRISGLTWEQLGLLFEVSRRSVHFWASGKPLNAAHEARLMRVLGVVRRADRGSARETRAALLDAGHGMTPFDLLAEQRFDDARAALGQGLKDTMPVLTELSAQARAARRPLPVEELFEALHDRVHHEPGHGRAARTVRNKRRGSP